MCPPSLLFREVVHNKLTVAAKEQSFSTTRSCAGRTCANHQRPPAHRKRQAGCFPSNIRQSLVLRASPNFSHCTTTPACSDVFPETHTNVLVLLSPESWKPAPREWGSGCWAGCRAYGCRAENHRMQTSSRWGRLPHSEAWLGSGGRVGAQPRGSNKLVHVGRRHHH